jgi:hypothetical protein
MLNPNRAFYSFEYVDIWLFSAKLKRISFSTSGLSGIPFYKHSSLFRKNSSDYSDFMGG